MKKIHRFSLLFLAALSVLFLSACGGQVPASTWPGLSVYQKLAYMADGGRVFAVNLDGMTQIWSYPDKPSTAKQFYTDPALTPDGQQLLLGAYDHVLYSVDPKTGADRWNFLTNDRIIVAPLVNETGIYLPSADANLYALDFSGKKRWTFTAGNGLWATPATDGKLLYVPSMDHFLYAVTQKDGKLVWKRDLGTAITGTPALSEDGSKLYVGTIGEEIYAIDSANGSVLWHKPVDGSIWSGPALKDKQLYFGSTDENLYIFNADQGTLVQKVKIGGTITGTPLVDKDWVVVSTGTGNLAAVMPNGSIKWNQPIGGKLYTSPKLVGDRYLIAFTQSTDKLLEYVDRNGTVVGAPFNLPK
ncbi:MAG TPA: PQQ-binding-like beta-propeller repeat protein [Anaerolineaceae bacterium]|nr:PQQ-binding-like beta-propeller repeat protein [Anaerolineaceae bacterium]